MPRRKKDANADDVFKFQSVYLQFSEAERHEIASLSGEERSIGGTDFEEWCIDGWKISISYSKAWNNWVFSFTPKEVSEMPSNLVYIVRHRDFERCIQITHFFFNYMVPNGDSRLRGEVMVDDW